MVLVWENDSLRNITGLDSLASIGGDLTFEENDNLTDVNGFSNFIIY